MTDIAIVGLSVDLPGAQNLDEYWQMISSATSMTRPFPADRRDKLSEYVRYLRQTTVDPVTETEVDFHNGCFLDTVDTFDYSVFGMNPKQAAVTDPHHRMVLRAMFLAFEDSGYSADRLRGSRTGVFVGFATNPGATYLDYICRIDPSLGQLALTGNIPTMLANRISHLLDLHGPSMVIDSACSATLVAVHQAKNALLAGDCEMAVVGGARIVFAPVKHRHSNIGIESSDGVTRTFDEAADGTGFGEGAGAVVLKRVEQAEADGDRIYAIIRGSAVNHDGNTEGITNPDSDSQAQLLLDAWKNADIDPRTLGYLEAHGTATRVGDPIEHEGMRRAFAMHTADRGFCAVGTVKANIGHLFEGSGVVGLIKAVAMLQHGQMPPQANYHTPNPKLDFAAGPLYVSTTLRPWESPDHPRRCGVSAFGIGGTNAHVVLEEYQQSPRCPAAVETPALFTISAATERSLAGLVEEYLRFIDAGKLAGVDMADVCYTSRISRAGHKYRLALVVTDAADLRAQLVDHQQGRTATAPDEFTATISAYVNGTPLEQQAEPHRRVVDLPSYVFDEVLSWISFPDTWRSQLSLTAPEAAQPVTHDVEFHPAAAISPDELDANAKVLALVDPDTASEAVVRAAGPAELTVLRLTEPFGADGEIFTADSTAAWDRIAQLVISENITHVVHALAFEAAPATKMAEVERRVEKNLHSLFLLSKALMAAAVKVELTVLTYKAISAEEGDRSTVTENAALVGFGKVIGREYPYIRVKHIDVDAAVPPDALHAEILSGEHGLFLRRGERRLREVFVEVPEVAEDGAQEYLTSGGCYLITGGTGALGLAVAQYFAAARPDITLVLLSRSGLPPREEWTQLSSTSGDSRLTDRIRAVQAMTDGGTTVRIHSADAGDPASLAEAVTSIQAEFGRIDGVVHAAGLPGESTVMFRKLEDFDAVIRAKLHAAFMIDWLTRADRPDFVLHFSSVASVFPAPGQADYAAANYYLDNLARSRAGSSCHVLAVDWVAWKEIGMAVDYGSNGDTMFKALPTAVGLNLLDAGLRSARSRLFAGELHYRGELIHLLKSYDITLSPDIYAKVELELLALDERLHKVASKIKDGVRAVQVDLTGREDTEGYTEIEQTVAQCLAFSFGYPSMDVEADFFDLGGDSIMAASVANNLSVCHEVQYDVADLLADRTISEIAYHLESLTEFQSEYVA